MTPSKSPKKRKRKRNFSKRSPKAVVIEEKLTDSNGNKFVLPYGCYFSKEKEQCKMKYIHQDRSQPCIKCGYNVFKYYICNGDHKQLHHAVFCISCYKQAISESVTKNNTKQAEKDTITATTQPGIPFQRPPPPTRPPPAPPITIHTQNNDMYKLPSFDPVSETPNVRRTSGLVNVAC